MRGVHFTILPVKCTPRILFIFLQEISLQEKNTEQFQALNGLKYSTVGNLIRFLVVIRYNVIRGYPLFCRTKRNTGLDEMSCFNQHNADE